MKSVFYHCCYKLATLSNSYLFLSSCYLNVNVICRKILKLRHFKYVKKEEKTVMKLALVTCLSHVPG